MQFLRNIYSLGHSTMKKLNNGVGIGNGFCLDFILSPSTLFNELPWSCCTLCSIQEPINKHSNKQQESSELIRPSCYKWKGVSHPIISVTFSTKVCPIAVVIKMEGICSIELFMINIFLYLHVCIVMN